MAFSGLIGEGAGTITSGQRNYAATGSNRRIPQVIEELIYENAHIAPFRVLSQKLGVKKTVAGPSYFHFETDSLPVSVQVSGSQTSGDTSIELTTNHGRRVQVNHRLLNVRTSEEVRVTSIATDTLTCTRGANGTTAAAMNNADELKLLGLMDTDGNTAPDGVSSEPTQVLNYVQIFKQAVEMTRRDMNAGVYTDDEKTRLMRDALQNLLIQIEQCYLFGVGIASSDPFATAGSDYWITTNVTNQAGAALDEQTWNVFLRNVWRFNQGSESLVCFLGTNVCETLDSFGRDMIRYAPEDKMLGIEVGRYQNSFGNLALTRHGLMDDVVGSEASYGRWGGRCHVYNMKRIGRAVYKNSDMRFEQDIQTPGADGKKWQWISDEGLWIGNEKQHGILKGVPALT